MGRRCRLQKFQDLACLKCLDGEHAGIGAQFPTWNMYIVLLLERTYMFLNMRDSILKSYIVHAILPLPATDATTGNIRIGRGA